MAIIKALVLGIVQGVTEFLPVSSSGHLVLGQHLFGIKEPEIFFDVMLHLGTLGAVCVVFRRDIWSLIKEFFYLLKILFNKSALAAAWQERPSFKLLVLILAGTIPTGIIGIVFKDTFESMFASTLTVGIALLVTGSILFLTGRIKQGTRDITGFRAVDALIIGLVQGMAIIPGISRSGSTISAGLFLKLDRELTARFSFLLSIPAILAAVALQVKDAGQSTFSPLELSLGFLAALISGFLALMLLLKIVRSGRLHVFAYYCWLIGLISLGLSLSG
ncbi:MAG: undecaprenyl-diphosphate phosphatase [Deltaproteobacteria bacterium]|nr:undecaprenyl-diphosphate phosphatase [Deltaproteobacteria bacterium]